MSEQLVKRLSVQINNTVCTREQAQLLHQWRHFQVIVPICFFWGVIRDFDKGVQLLIEQIIFKLNYIVLGTAGHFNHEPIPPWR